MELRVFCLAIILFHTPYPGVLFPYLLVSNHIFHFYCFEVAIANLCKLLSYGIWMKIVLLYAQVFFMYIELRVT